ncbi:hypothetical protein [Deinococcus roseus]|uniref:Uncharacterized protein n=1 Tax=Deinococcus roseus TaxID=392414 RepID=A0ABQ2D916_9DEIO|nr:hypothetical protein [Deinococcus roseus]GGJ49892.1 hypothetical protein GCM10008938_39820 [Deinococcus roseus]
MAEVKRHGDLDIDTDSKHSELQWKIQHVGWWAMFLLILLGLLGLLGPGFLSHRNVQGTGLKVQYEHFLHLDTPTLLEAELQQDAEHPVLTLAQDYLKAFEIQSIQPEPEKMTIQDGKYRVAFHALSRGATIQMKLIPQQTGRVEGDLALEPDPAVEIRHFVYP